MKLLWFSYIPIDKYVVVSIATLIEDDLIVLIMLSSTARLGKLFCICVETGEEWRERKE